jgi:translation initiation factor 2 subunit 1
MYKKDNLPEVDDLVVCTIERVVPHSCFVKLDEYGNAEGMVHTSEMDRRWVRNMKVYLKVGRQLVCKVMDVNPEHNQVNLSIRRVGEGQRRSKLQFWKNEKRADDLLQYFAKQNKLKVEEIYTKFATQILEKYGALYPFFLEVAKMGEDTLNEFKIDSKLAHNLFTLIQQRIKIPQTEIRGTLKMYSTKGDGLLMIKRAVADAEKFAEKNDVKLVLDYAGTPRYQFKVICEDKKQADKLSIEIVERMRASVGGKGNVELKRE